MSYQEFATIKAAYSFIKRNGLELFSSIEEEYNFDGGKTYIVWFKIKED